MERKEILEKIKTTEAEIRTTIESAQHKRNEILTQTQKQAQKLEDEGEKQMRVERDNSLLTAKKQIEKKRQQILMKAQTDAETIKKKAKINKAKELFIQKFMEFIHV